ncbi:MAG TPA: class I adenylate-forming enzyme family protein [Acidimicrobiales bacterium]
MREAAWRFGETVAFVDPDGTPLTYAELDRRSDEIAAALIRRRHKRGDRVVLRLPSDTSYVIAYVGIAKLGGVTAGINPKLAVPEQDVLEELVEPALVLSDPAEVRLLEAEGRGRRVPDLEPDPDRPVAIVFTSGTTGLPRAALFKEAQLSAVAAIDTGDVWAPAGTVGPAMLASTQFAHVGFMTKLPWYLRMAMRIHIPDRWNADDALRTIAEQQMPSIGGVAPQLALMLRSPVLSEHDWSHVKTIVMGGAASQPALVDAARRAFGADYSIRYSSTESGGCGTATAFDADDAEALYTIGKPRPGIQAAVIDEEGMPKPVGEVGDLWLRSPTQMSEYWNDPEATAVTIVDGWLRTGDLAWVDERGNLVLAGRQSDMYIRGGYNVHPAEIEGQLIAHPAVADAVVVPRPDPVMGEIGVAVVVPADPAAPPTLEDLRTHLAPRLAAHKLPEALRVVPELPLTSGQKVDRMLLAAEEAASTVELIGPDQAPQPASQPESG